MARKRILIFSLQYYPLVGGAEVAIKEITDRISPEEAQFDMITLRFDSNLPQTEQIGNVRVHRIGWGRKGLTFAQSFSPLFYLSKVLFVPMAALKASGLHRAQRYDAAWAMMTYMVFPLVLLRMIGIRLPYLLTLQEGDPFERVFERWYIRLVSPLLLFGIRHAARVQAISHFLAEWVRRCGYAGEVEVVPNGVDLTKFIAEFPEREIAAEREKLGKKNGETWLVTTSRLVHKNAVDDVIRALAHLPAEVHFAVFGIGPEEEKLKKLAKETGVDSHVHFFGHLDHADMPRALAACDIFIRPSRSEGQGISFIEAMAAGIPVIATQEGGISDFLFDAQRNPDKEATGWAVDSDAPEQIAQAVEDIIAHPEQARKITRTAQDMVSKEYDWDRIAGRMRGLFLALK